MKSHAIRSRETMLSTRSIAAEWLSAASRDAALAVIPLEFEEAIVERIDEVGRRRPGLPAANAAVFDHHHGLPNLGKQISSREPGDTSADDADIAVGIGSQWRICGNLGRFGPDRSFRRGSHGLHASNACAFGEAAA